MSLYIGANYHPHDWEPDRWRKDIQLMKNAGFTTVRLGHLCWDSYEPDEGVYTFEWFDEVMELFAINGINVILDVSMHPAPVWVHKLCPGCDISGPSGNRQASLRRYMEDVDDTSYQVYALRFAEKLVKRYKSHPALLGFGLCNELGDGFLSHSEYARQRFVNWLKKKYKTVDCLNQAWAAQRWCRKLNSFDEVVLQENEVTVGAPEAWLDMRRFFSDGIGNFIASLKDVVEEGAPGVPHSSNHFADKENLGFDYLKACEHFVNYPGMGFYPGYNPNKGNSLIYTLSFYMERIAETGKPMWCLEFTTGSTGIYSGTYGMNRMYAFLCLLHRAQMVLGWTFRSMLNGEEQFLYGLLDHDGTPNQNYDEYTKIAEDFKKLEHYGFPYLPEPEIAVAYSFDSSLIASYHKQQFRLTYQENMVQALAPLEKSNRDYNIVDLRNRKNNYKLLIIPGYIIMDEKSAESVRSFVESGGTAVMTGYSAVMDETARVYGTSRPGRLTDVFGVKVEGFYRTSGIELPKEEEAAISRDPEDQQELLKIEREESSFYIKADYYEKLKLETAEVYAQYSDKKLCAVSRNNYGKGKAYYISSETNETLLEWLLENIAEEAELSENIITPKGIYARRIAEHQTFYVNTTGKAEQIKLTKEGYGILGGKDYEKELILAPYDGELIVDK